MSQMLVAIGGGAALLRCGGGLGPLPASIAAGNVKDFPATSIQARDDTQAR